MELLVIVYLSILPLFYCYKNEYDNDCQYQFQIWKPSENALKQLRDMEFALNITQLSIEKEVCYSSFIT